MKMLHASILAALACAPVAAGAQALPSRLDPPAPFPRIITDAPIVEQVAPGVTSARYILRTDAGPIVANVIAVAPHRSDVRIDSMLAGDELSSPGETISSMARRSGAVAGINADYFDIGASNRPTNIVVHNGRLVRTPRKRYALVITSDGTPKIVENAFTGQVSIGTHSVDLNAVNELPPPQGGTSLLTPAFGPIPPSDNLTIAALTPTEGTPPFATYSVTSVVDNTQRQAPGYYLAIGLNAYGGAGVPNTGDTVVASGDLSPIAASDIVAAVGGGPMILQNGTWYDDPDGPSGREFALRIPASGAAIEPDGTLLLIEVDGRQADHSVGVTRPELAAFMRGLGAETGMAFDGGGSAEIATRRLGSQAPTLDNRPSDGKERRVSDGIFVYSMAETGPAVELVAQPGTVRAIVGAQVPLHIAAIDAGDHAQAPPEPVSITVQPASLGEVRDGVFIPRTSGEGAIVMQSGTLAGRVAVYAYAQPARLTIQPSNPNVAQNGRIALRVSAFDAQGYQLALPPELQWRATGASITTDGVVAAGTHDAAISVAIGDVVASTALTVGSHDIALPFVTQAHFMTVPRDGDGAVTRTPDGIEVRYALGPSERAAYAAAEVPLPKATIGLAFDLRDDGSQARLRVAFRNAINEQVLVNATTLDHPGWRHVVVRLPEETAQPARLSAIYVLGAGSSVTSGSIEIKNVTAVVAGSS